MRKLGPYRIGLFAVAALVLVIVIGLAIRRTSDGSPADQSSGSLGMPAKCAQHMPGDLLSAKDAVVLFDTERVCLGYVTVEPTTAVTWENRDDVSHRVTVLSVDGKKTIFAEKVPSGESVSKTLPAGFYLYRTDALPSFTGTVEVVDPATPTSTP